MRVYPLRAATFSVLLDCRFTNGPVCLKNIPRDDSAEVEPTLSLDLLLKGLFAAPWVFFDGRLTNGPFCGYALEREDSAERDRLRGGLTETPEVAVRFTLNLPDRVNRLFAAVSVFLEALLTKGPCCGYTLLRAASGVLERDRIRFPIGFEALSLPVRIFFLYGDGLE